MDSDFSDPWFADFLDLFVCVFSPLFWVSTELSSQGPGLNGCDLGFVWIL